MATLALTAGYQYAGFRKNIIFNMAKSKKVKNKSEPQKISKLKHKSDGEASQLKPDDLISDSDFSDDDDDFDVDEGLSKRKSVFHQAVGLTENEIRKLNETRSAALHTDSKRSTCASASTTKRSHPPPEIIVFQDPSVKYKKPKVVNQSESAESGRDKCDVSPSPQIDLRTARQEVHRFGLKGLQGGDKDQAIVDLLVKLGAKAPKNKYKNYKDLIEEKKEEKQKLLDMKSNRLFMDEGKIKALQSFHKYQSKLKKKDSGPVDGRHVGLNGVKVKQRDLDKMSHKKGKRK